MHDINILLASFRSRLFCVNILFVTLTLLAYLALIGCNGERLGSKKSISSKSDKRPANHKPNDYFPLFVSNKWEYEVNIPADSDYYTVYFYIGEKAPVGFGRKSKQGQIKVGYEIYAISNNTYKLNILDDELALFQGSENVCINEIRIGDPLSAGGSTAVEFRAEKDMTILNSKGFTFPICIRYMDNSMMYGGLNDNAYLTIMPEYNELHEISLPAGTFHQCVKQIVFVRPDNMNKDKYNNHTSEYDQKLIMKKGWRIESYFAPGIGLVLQNQFDLGGHKLNEMKIISWKISKTD